MTTALTPSRHPAGSPIPLDGVTRTEPGFDGRPAPPSRLLLPTQLQGPHNEHPHDISRADG